MEAPSKILMLHEKDSPTIASSEQIYIPCRRAFKARKLRELKEVLRDGLYTGIQNTDQGI